MKRYVLDSDDELEVLKRMEEWKTTRPRVETFNATHKEMKETGAMGEIATFKCFPDMLEPIDSSHDWRAFFQEGEIKTESMRYEGKGHLYPIQATVYDKVGDDFGLTKNVEQVVMLAWSDRNTREVKIDKSIRYMDIYSNENLLSIQKKYFFSWLVNARKGVYTCKHLHERDFLVEKFKIMKEHQLLTYDDTKKRRYKRYGIEILPYLPRTGIRIRIGYDIKEDDTIKDILEALGVI